MGLGFGAIVDCDLNLYFIEPDYGGDISHRNILRRLKWRDNDDAFTRRFVRIECADWTMASFRFDENTTLPGWAEEHAKEIQNGVERTLTKAAPALAEYKQVRDQARAVYEKGNARAYEEYEEIRVPAWVELTLVFSQIPGYVPTMQNGLR